MAKVCFRLRKGANFGSFAFYLDHRYFFLVFTKRLARLGDLVEISTMY